MSQPLVSALEWRKRVRIDRYAMVFAHVVHFGPEHIEEVLDHFGLGLADWQALDAAWSAELVEVVRRQQGELAMRFSSTLFRVRGDLAKRQPALSSIGEKVLRAAPPGESQASPIPQGRPLLSYVLAESRQPALQRQTPLPPEPMPLPPAPSPSRGPAPGNTGILRPAKVSAFLTETGAVDTQAVLRGQNLPFSSGRGGDGRSLSPVPAGSVRGDLAESQAR